MHEDQPADKIIEVGDLPGMVQPLSPFPSLVRCVLTQLLWMMAASSYDTEEASLWLG